MLFTLEELKEKEIVNLNDGKCFGFADDVLIDCETRKTVALIIYGKLKFFGILGREEDISVSWDKIETIGEDTVLVNVRESSKINNKKENFFQKFLNKFLY